jgi:carboxyl-terminal processing protease
MTIIRPQSALSAALLAMYLAVTGLFAPASAQRAATAEPPDPLTARLELMLRSMRIAREWHVGRPTKSELVAGAIEGLLARLDPEAELYSRAELRRLSRFAAAGDGNVGLEVRREPPARRQERRGYRVVSVRDGSPAATAGLKAGDLVTRVNDQPAGEIAHLVMVMVELPGPVGTELRLTVERAGDEAPAEVVLARAPAVAPPIALDEVALGIARVRLAAIDAETANGLDAVLGALATLPTGASRGIIIDLRSAAGDGPDAAGAVGDAFLDSGSLLRIEARSTDRGRTLEATPGDWVQGRPIVVLVDGGTAGAAEAIAAALHDNHRARLVGTRTAGRGALRTLVAIGSRGEKGALRMTTERMVTPAGAALEGNGLMPDMVVEQTPPSARCRSLDIEDKLEPTRCVRRAAGEDAQLARAIVLLDEAQMAAKGVAGAGKP